MLALWLLALLLSTAFLAHRRTAPLPALGIVAGLLLGSIRAFNDTVGLVMEFIKGIPPIAVAPL